MTDITADYLRLAVSHARAKGERYLMVSCDVLDIVLETPETKARHCPCADHSGDVCICYSHDCEVDPPGSFPARPSGGLTLGKWPPFDP